MVIDSGLSPGAIAGIVVVAVLSLIAAVAAVFIYRKCRARRKKTQNNHDQRNNFEVLTHDQSTTPLTHEVNACNGTTNGNHVGH